MPDWDEKYRKGEYAGDEPSSLLVSCVANLKPGRVLDLACGAGRHALYLARRDWQVEAVDSSRVAIEMLVSKIAAEKLPIQARVDDLESGLYTIEEQSYDLICDFYYLHRPLFPLIRRGILPGGRFVAAIHMVDPDPMVRPMNPEFLLEAGELQNIFDDWEILQYHEGRPIDPAHQRRTAELVAVAPRQISGVKK